MKKNRIIIFDTTLRDGEQCPGASMTLREKLEVARQLARLKVDVIEGGFPVISDGDFTAVNTIAKEIKGPIIAGLARCVPKDIEAAGKAVAPAGIKGHNNIMSSTIFKKSGKYLGSYPSRSKSASIVSSSGS